jgi:hypothetical protein
MDNEISMEEKISRRRHEAKVAKSGPRLKVDDVPADLLARGEAAWKRRKANAPREYDDWIDVGETLWAGKQRAIKIAGRFRGPTYNSTFSAWLKQTQLKEIRKDVRADLLQLMERRREIEKWRDGLPEVECLSLNHPTCIMRAYREWKCSSRGNKGEPKEPSTEAEGGLTRVSGQKTWEGRLDRVAQQAIGAADDMGRLSLKPPEPGLIKTVREAAAALTKIADELQRIADGA